MPSATVDIVPASTSAADVLARIRRRVLFAAVLMILLGLSLSGTYSYYRARADSERTDDWRDAARYILSQAEPGDAVLFSYSEERLAFDEYQRQFHLADSPICKFPDRTDLELLTQRPSRPSPELLDNIVAGGIGNDRDGQLAGGLYGVRINGLFAGESMFHVQRDASKVALMALVALMRETGMTLLDVQWRTEHLASLGAVGVARDQYLAILADALGRATA
jgi:hypothetical protein